MLSTGRVGLEEKSPIHVADVVRMMSETNPAKSGSGDLVSTRGDQARGGQNGSSIKISERGRADGVILPRSVTFADQQPPVAGQRGISPGREVANARTPRRDHPNPKRDRSGEEDRLMATQSRIVQRYDQTLSKTDLNVVSPSIKHGNSVGNTEIFVSHRWAPREETKTEPTRSSRNRTVRVLSNIKSMGDGFVAEEVDNERQSSGASDVSPRNRKRPLSSGSVSASIGETQNEFGVPSATDCNVDEVSPESYAEAVRNKNWRDSMTAEIKALRNRGCWRVVRTPQGAKLIKSKYVYKIKKDWAGKIIKRKSRLVVQGFSQVEGVDFNETFAPVAKVTTFRLMLALSKVLNLHIHQLEVDSAFL